MRDYILRRLLSSLLVIIGCSILTFFMLHMVPGDPVRLMYGQKPVSAETLQTVRHELGLDMPVPLQYLRYVSRALVGDLGRSIRSNRPVSEEILSRAPATIQLALAGMLLSLLMGMPVGMLSALKRGSWLDKLVMFGSLTGVSMPHFWLGLMLIFAFAVQLHWFPILPDDSWHSLVLPAATLAFGEAGVMARTLRTSMLQVLGEEYLVTARAKGLSERMVIVRHALRNALIPVVTMMGMDIGYYFGGSVMIETVFGRQGMGRLAVDAVTSRNFPIVQGTVLIASVVFVLSNTLVDVLYATLDPRIRYS
jgi:peptide/nickel transport system permease protein